MRPQPSGGPRGDAGADHPGAGTNAPALAPDVPLREALRRLAARLAGAGIEPAAQEARFLALGVLGLAPRDLALDGEVLLGPRAAPLAAALARRLRGEPTARILGAWEFWGLPMRLSPETLVPRPDTESVVEAGLAALPDREAASSILDLGTGTGCILVALLGERPRARGLGLDRSEGALRTARGNALANGVGARAGFVAGDWCAPLSGAFDLVVSNPPYIASDAIRDLAHEVRAHDPGLALDGGPDGLAAYRAILAGLRGGRLRAGGRLVVEVGFDQADLVADLGRRAGYGLRAVTHDLAGIARVLTFDASAA